ncbi:MAG: uroporphyrinogen-III synthase [Blastocatellales bacterium]|nr:uroporphyrinogen-III synthase [Blastocatellales bacterium]
MALPEKTQRLAGTRIIITRAREQALPLAEELSVLGAEVRVLPLIEIGPPSDFGPLDSAISRIETFDWLIFASAHAVEFFLKRFDQMGGDRQMLARPRIAAVGPKTGRALERRGLKVTMMPAMYTAESLVDAFIEQYTNPEEMCGVRVLLPASSITSDVIRPALNRFGAQVEIVDAYSNVMPETGREDLLIDLEPSQQGYILFASPSAVNNLARLLGVNDLASELGRLRALCIGPTTAEAASRLGLKIDALPAPYSIESLVAIIEKEAER